MPFRPLFLVALLAVAALPARAQVDGTLSGLTRLQQGVRTKRVSSYDQTGGNRDRFENIKTGERRTMFDVPGAGQINHIWITIGPYPPELSRNDIVLRMYWDGSDAPCVEAPIGPFFGQGWDESYDFSSLPLAAGPVDGRALVSYFVMPFANGARIEIENQSDRAIDFLYFYIDYTEVDALPGDTGRFHAWYNHELTEALSGGENEWSLMGPQGKNTTGDGNYLFADIGGRGHFVGVNYYVHSPGPVWYGEGDDMFFIDGEAWPPDLHGTGTEDYFNTAWVPKDLFNHPYFGYPRINEDFGWQGRTHVFRFHVQDPVYFDESLRFSIEHGHDNALTLDLASVAYWYQAEPHKAFAPFPTREDRAPKPLIQHFEVHRWRDAWRKAKGGDPKLWGDEN